MSQCPPSTRSMQGLQLPITPHATLNSPFGQAPPQLQLQFAPVTPSMGGNPFLSKRIVNQPDDTIHGERFGISIRKT